MQPTIGREIGANLELGGCVAYSVSNFFLPRFNYRSVLMFFLPGNPYYEYGG